MRADRLLRLLMLLQRHRRATAPWLAGELEVSTRTVLRDIEALSAAGVPVYTERGKGGGCALLGDFTTEASGLTPGEAQALFAWASRESTGELGLGGDLRSALAKIAATAPAGALRQAESFGEHVLADRRRWYAAVDEVPLLPALRQAIEDGRRIRATYRSAAATGASSRVLHPIGLVDNSGRWYLVAEHRRQLRTYRVSRFRAVTVLTAPIDRHDQRPLAEIWNELRRGVEGSAVTAIDVVLDVRSAHAADLRRMLTMNLAAGSEIVVTAAPDPTSDDGNGPGTERWTFAARQSGVVAAMAVMSAPELTVIEPAWLRADVVAAARRTLAHYV